MTKKQNYINHIGLILDRSASMWAHKEALIKVVDGQVAHLAQRSTQMKQETRISVWIFNDFAECVVWDMDVLRLPSIREFYNPAGNTALIDATLLGLRDLALTPEKYGDHSFLLFTFTDGEENRSHNQPHILTDHISKLPDHWTVAALVPNMSGKHEAKRFGFPADNIQIWDTTSQQGLEEAGIAIAGATDAYMAMRATGTRSTRNLFTMTPVDPKALAATGIKPLPLDKFQLVHVPTDAVIQPFVESCGLKYVLGMAYYEMVKRERIQAQKKVAVMNKKTSEVFVGLDARKILGLPDHEVRVSPGFNKDYRVFVQSTSVNRKLPAHSGLLLLS